MRSAVSIFLLFLFVIWGCRENSESTSGQSHTQNIIRHAKGFSIQKFKGYSIVKIVNPWPKAAKDYTYVLREYGKIPDSLKKYQSLKIPVKKIVVTSTTHIPSLEMLGVSHTLIGFPNLAYVSSEKVRSRIDAGHVSEIGSNQALNTEIIIDLQPDVIIGFGIDNNNPALDNLQKSGLKVMLNGDWNEQTPLGKAEWIKFFGAIYGIGDKADLIFENIEKEYNNTLALVKRSTTKPTVMAGAVYENRWYLPHGDSWGSLLIAQAGGKYLWSDSHGSGSLSLPFETVLEKAKNADFWVGPGQFVTLKEMTDSNPHYAQFDAFKNGNVYSYSTKKGKTGGLIYYELAPNRPDIVLKDIVKILHPEILPDHQLFFFEKLN